MVTRSLSGTIEISTAALTVDEKPPVFTGEAGALAVSISFTNNNQAADISAYKAEMYLFWPERREMTDTVTMTVSGSSASAVFPDRLTVAAGAPLLIIQLTDETTGDLLVACAQPIQITETRGISVITTRPPTPSEVIYVGRSPYVDSTTGHWMEWDTDTDAYADTGITAKGDTGTSIVSITKTGTSGLVDTYTILLSDGDTHTFEVTNGADIATVAKTGTSGLVDTWTITMTNGDTHTFTITNGRGISQITGPSSVGLIDTYTISYNDGTTSTFAVSNGNGISSVTKTGTSGLTDTYTITFTDGTTTAYTVVNGKGISSSEIRYQAGTSGTTPPTGTWQSNPPTVPQGGFLWTRIVCTYNDGTSDTAYSVAYQGTDGQGAVSTVDSISASSGNVQLLTIGTAPPTSSTAGSVGSRFFDKTAGCLYICTASSGGSQTWQMAGSSIEVDQALSTTSTNPVENRVITNALAQKVEATEIVFNVAAWSNDVYWPSGNGTHPLGETANVCSRAEITQDADGNAIDCANGDGFVVTEWSQAKLPAPVWVYVDTGKIWVATRNTQTPSSQITIKGLILHRG